MIWKQLKRPLLNFPNYILNMNALPMRCSGWGGCNLFKGNLKNQQRLFKFNALYSTDPRLPDTTLWIAESVSKFAAPEQACDIYDNLGKFLDQPPESFVARLKELSDGANCSS